MQHLTSIQPLIQKGRLQGLKVSEEEYYTSNLSEAFQRAEQETLKAERLLTQWKNNDLSFEQQKASRFQNKYHHDVNKENNESTRVRESILDPFQLQQEQIQQLHKFNNPKFSNQILATNIENSSFEKDYGSLKSGSEYQSQINQADKRLQPQVIVSSSTYSTFQNQAGLTHSDTLDQGYSTVNSNKQLINQNFAQQKNNAVPQRQLQYQSLQNVREQDYYQDNDENYDQSNINIAGEEYELKQKQLMMQPQQKLKPQIHNISQTTQQESMHQQSYGGRSGSYQNLRNNSSSFIQNESVFRESQNDGNQQQHLTTRTPSITSYQQKYMPKNAKLLLNQELDLKGHLQTLQVNNPSTLSPAANPSQNTLQPNAIDLVNVEYENEILQLDKHYRNMLKSEREEFERKLARTQQQAEKNAEKKIKSQLRELRDQVEQYEGLQIQVDRLKGVNDRLTKECESLEKAKKKSDSKCQRAEEQLQLVQRKLDDMWERHKAEKDNAKLVTKFEVETESRKTINELTMKVIELEKQLNDKNHDQDILSKLLDRTRLEAQQTEQSFSRYLQNKSQDQILECESQILKSQNRQLQDQLQVIELELAEKTKKLASIGGSEKLLSEKYESLKKKFALTVKEKEQLEQNKLQETAKFKEMANGERSGQNTSKNIESIQISEFKHECKKCIKLEKAVSELAESYQSLINKLRNDVQTLKQESKDYIQHGQRDIHQTIIRKLRSYLEQMKRKEEQSRTIKANENENAKNTKKVKTSRINGASGQFGQKKNSVVILSKQNSQNLFTNEENIPAKCDLHFSNQTAGTSSKTSLTERGGGGGDAQIMGRRYTQTLDHITSQSTLDPYPPHSINQRTIQEKSQILSSKLDQIQNTLLHKSIIAKSTQRTRRSNGNSNTFAATASNPLTSMNTMNSSSLNDQSSFNNISQIKRSVPNQKRDKPAVQQNHNQNQNHNQINERMNTTIISAIDTSSYLPTGKLDYSDVQRKRMADPSIYQNERDQNSKKDYYELNESRKIERGEIVFHYSGEANGRKALIDASKAKLKKGDRTRSQRKAKNGVPRVTEVAQNRSKSLQARDTSQAVIRNTKQRLKSHKSKNRQSRGKSDKSNSAKVNGVKESHSIIIPTVPHNQMEKPSHQAYIGGGGRIASLRNKTHKFDF